MKSVKKKSILVDSYSNFDNLKKIILGKNDIQIFTFDYESHKKLNEEKIPHLISDNFVSDDEYKKIQNYVYRFSYWYSDKELQEFLNYAGINIGRLYLDELVNFFVRFLKKFKEIELIFKKHPNMEFHAENELFQIVHFFTDSAIDLSQKKKFSQDYTHDLIKINFKFGYFKKDIFLKRNSYLRLKRVFDYLTNIILTSKTDPNKTKILFSEYNTERFKKLFLDSKKFNSQIFFFGRRRPSFWNFETLKTIYNSNCKIITKNSLGNDIVEENSKKGIDLMHNRLKNIWSNNKLLNKLFTFERYEIFELIRPTLYELIEEKLSHTIYEIELTKTMFQKFKFDHTVIINESGFSEQIIASLSKTNGINCIHMQEGFHWDSEGASENLISQGVFIHDAAKLQVWGEIDMILSKNIGNVPLDKIQVIGAPRYDELFTSIKKKSNYILLASSADPQPEEVEGLRIKKIQKYLDDILETSKIISELGEKLVIKLHPSKTQLVDISKLAPKINPKISVSSYGEISSLLPSAKLLISVGLSSAMIEAMILKIPVIFIPGIDYNWGIPTIISETGCYISNTTELKSTLEKILSNSNNSVQNISSKNYLSKLINFQGGASEKFYNSISKTKNL